MSQEFWNSVNFAITKFRVNNTTIYKCIIYEIKKHSQVKALLDFTIEPVSNSYFILYIYTIQVIVVKLDDGRASMSFGCWTPCSFYYVRFPSQTINIFCQKRIMVAVVPLSADDVSRIMKINLIPGHFLSSLNFSISFRLDRPVTAP